VEPFCNGQVYDASFALYSKDPDGNFYEHVEEDREASRPEAPTAFIKISTALIGPEDPIFYPAITKELDYEVEVAAVIGKKGKSYLICFAPISQTRNDSMRKSMNLIGLNLSLIRKRALLAQEGDGKEVSTVKRFMIPRVAHCSGGH